MTHDLDPTSNTPDVERLRREIARLQDELAEAESRHATEIARIKSSNHYRIGSVVAGLRRPSGWRRLPTELRALWSGTRPRRGGQATTARPDVSPRSSIVADSVLDEFSERALERELTLRPVARRARRPSTSAAMFLAESAWLGNEGQWRYQFSSFEDGNDLDRLVGRYRSSGTPTVFWNKEDPAHFETFLAAARRFDHVLTTDADCVDRYRRELGHDRVGTLPFAAQPAIHNPMGRHTDPRSICFAGAWRGDVHPQRIDQLTTLLDAALAVGDLRIYARRPTDGRADFPERYRAAIVGEIPYDAMVAEYRRHACFLNVNTVTTSPTMLSRRVFEILACRTPVVSAPSPAIEQFFDGVVPTPASASEARSVITDLVDDPTRRDHLGQRGYRLVMSNHTYQHRVATICDAVGIDGFPGPQLPTVDAIVEVPSIDDVSRALSTLEPIRASLGHVAVVCADGSADGAPHVEARDDVSVVRVAPSRSAAEVLQRLPGDGQFVAFLDAEASYGPQFVDDTMLATRFADADVYGKSASHAGGPAGVWAIGDGHEFHVTSDVLDGTAIVRRTIFGNASTTSNDGVSLGRSAVAAATTKFAVDRFNHVAGPHRADRSGASRPITDAIC